MKVHFAALLATVVAAENTAHSPEVDGPVDCVGQWSVWSEPRASCGVFNAVRRFEVSVPAARGGKRCEVTDGRREAMTMEVPCPIDCNGAWSAWTECSRSCGAGTKSREFSVIQPEAHGGEPCTTKGAGTCQGPPCPGDEPVEDADCVGRWGGWTKCSVSCGGGTRRRHFRVDSPAVGRGQPCPQDLVEICAQAPCDPKADDKRIAALAAKARAAAQIEHASAEELNEALAKRRRGRRSPSPPPPPESAAAKTDVTSPHSSNDQQSDASTKSGSGSDLQLAVALYVVVTLAMLATQGVAGGATNTKQD